MEEDCCRCRGLCVCGVGGVGGGWLSTDTEPEPEPAAKEEEAEETEEAAKKKEAAEKKPEATTTSLGSADEKSGGGGSESNQDQTETPQPSPIVCEGSWGQYSDWSWLSVSESQSSSSQQPNLTNPYNCGPREKIQQYSITTSAENGGTECPSKAGDTRNRIDSIATPCSCNFESTVQNINNKDSTNYLGTLIDQPFTMDPPSEPSSPPKTYDLKDYFEMSSYPNYEIGPRSHSNDGVKNKMNIVDYNTNKNNLFKVNCFTDGTYNFTYSTDPPTESTPVIPPHFPDHYLYCKENNQLQNLFNSQIDGIHLTNPVGTFNDLEFNLSVNYNSPNDPLTWNQLGLSQEQDKSNYSCPSKQFLVDKLDATGSPILNPFCGDQGLELPYECLEYCSVNSDINDILLDPESEYSYQGGMNFKNLRSSVEAAKKGQSETFTENTIIKCADGYSGEPVLTCGDDGFFTLSGCIQTTCATFDVSKASEVADHVIDPAANLSVPCSPNCGNKVDDDPPGCLKDLTRVDCSESSTDNCEIFLKTNHVYDSTSQDNIYQCCDTSSLKSNIIDYINTACGEKNKGYVINPYYDRSRLKNALSSYIRGGVDEWNEDSNYLLDGINTTNQDKLTNQDDNIKKPLCIPGQELKCTNVTCSNGKILLSNKYINPREEPETNCCYNKDTMFTYKDDDWTQFINSDPINNELNITSMDQLLKSNRKSLTTDVNNSGLFTQDNVGIFRNEDISICNYNSLLLTVDPQDDDNLNKNFDIKNCNTKCKISNNYLNQKSVDTNILPPNGNLLTRYRNISNDNFKHLLDDGSIFQEIISGEPEEIPDDKDNKLLDVTKFNNKIRTNNGICGGESSRVEGGDATNIFCSQFDPGESCNESCDTIYKCPQYVDPSPIPSLVSMYGGEDVDNYFNEPELLDNNLWYTVWNAPKEPSDGDDCPIWRLGGKYQDDAPDDKRWELFNLSDDTRKHNWDGRSNNPKYVNEYRQTTQDDINLYSDICGDSIHKVKKVYTPEIYPQIYHQGDENQPPGYTCNPIGCGPKDNNTEQFYINNYSYLNGLISNFSDTPNYGAINDNDTGYHGLYGECGGGNFQLKGCDVRVDMDRSQTQNNPSNPLFLYKSSISVNGNQNYEPCSDFIDYETITYDYVNNTITPEITHAVDSPQGSSNTEAYTLCSNQDNVVFYPHLDNQACSPGFYPINNVSILNGDQIYENCTGNSATDCNSDFCRWNENNSTCEKLNKARCKEIVEQGTQESIAQGGTYIHNLTTENTYFGNYSNYYTDCPDSYFTSPDSAYKPKSFYNSILKYAGSPDFYTKNVEVGSVPTMINRMNCNSNKDLFNDIHKIYDTSLLNDQPGNLRFRFHKENDLELINNSMGSDTSLNLCSPGNILTLEDNSDTNTILNFVCEPCPLPDGSGLNSNSNPICYRNPLSDSSKILTHFNDSRNIQIKNIIPDTTSGSSVQMCSDGHMYSYDSATKVGQCIPRTCTVSDTDGIIKNTGTTTDYIYGGEEFNLYEQALNGDLIEGFGYSNNTQFDVSEPSCSGNKDVLKNTCRSVDTCSDENCLTIADIYEPGETDIDPATKVIDSLPSGSNDSISIDNPCSNFKDATQYRTKEDCVNNNENNVWVPFNSPYYTSLNNTISTSNLNDSIETDITGICLSLNKYKDSDEINSLLNSGILPDRDLLDKNTGAKHNTIHKLFEKKGEKDILSYKTSLIDSFNTDKGKCASSLNLWAENVHDANYDCTDICTKRTGNKTTDTCSQSSTPFSNSVSDKDSIDIFNMMKPDYINCDKYIVGNFKRPPKDKSYFDTKIDDEKHWYKQWDNTLDFNNPTGLPGEQFSNEVLNKTETGTFENFTHGCYNDINFTEATEMCNQSNTCSGFYTGNQWNDRPSKGDITKKSRACFKSGYNDASYPLDGTTKKAGNSGMTFFTKQNTDKPYCSTPKYDAQQNDDILLTHYNNISQLEYELPPNKPIDLTQDNNTGTCVCPPGTILEEHPEPGSGEDLWRCSDIQGLKGNRDDETRIEFPYIYHTYDKPACVGDAAIQYGAMGCIGADADECHTRYALSPEKAGVGAQCFLDGRGQCRMEITAAENQGSRGDGSGQEHNKLCLPTDPPDLSKTRSVSTICMVPDKDYENNCSSKRSYPDVDNSKYHEDRDYNYIKYDNTVEFKLKGVACGAHGCMAPDPPTTEIIEGTSGGSVRSDDKSCINNINLEDAKTICNKSKTCYGFGTNSDATGVNTGTGYACFRDGYGDPLWADGNLEAGGHTGNNATFYKKEFFTTGVNEFNNDSFPNKFKLCPCTSDKCPREPDINTTDILDLPLTKMTEPELIQLNQYDSNKDIDNPGVSSYFDKLTDIMGNEMNPEINVFTKGYDPTVGNHFDRNAYTGCIPIDEPEKSTCVERDAYDNDANSVLTAKAAGGAHGNRLWITGNTPMNTYEPGSSPIFNDKELINWYNNVDTCGWIMHFGDINEPEKKTKLKNKYSRICNRQIYKGNEAKAVPEYVTPGGDFSYDDGHSSNIGSFSSTPEIVSDMMKEEGVGDVKNQMIPQYYKYNKSELSSINQEMKPEFVGDSTDNDTYKSLCTSQLSQDGDTLVCSYNVMFDGKQDVQDGTVTDTTTEIKDISKFPDKGLLKTNYSQRASLLQPYFGYLSNTDGSNQNQYLENKTSAKWSSAFGDTFDRVPTIDYFYSNIDDFAKMDNYYTTKQNSPAGGELDNNYEEGQDYPGTEGFSGNKTDNDFKKPKDDIKCGWKNHVWHDIKDSYDDDLVHQYINDHYKDICTGIPATVSSTSGNIMTYSDIWLVPDTCMPRTEIERNKIGTCPDCEWGNPERFLGDGETTGLNGNPKDPTNYYDDEDIHTDRTRPSKAKDGLGKIMNARSDFAYNNRGFCAPCPPNTALNKTPEGKLMCSPLAVDEYSVNPSFFLRELNELNDDDASTGKVFLNPTPSNTPLTNITATSPDAKGDIRLNSLLYSTDVEEKISGQPDNGYFKNSMDFYYYNGQHGDPQALDIYNGYITEQSCGDPQNPSKCYFQDSTKNASETVGVSLWDPSTHKRRSPDTLTDVKDNPLSKYIQQCPSGWASNNDRWSSNSPSGKKVKIDKDSENNKKTSFGLLYDKLNHYSGESTKHFLDFTLNKKATDLGNNENIRTVTCGSAESTNNSNYDSVCQENYKSGWNVHGSGYNAEICESSVKGKVKGGSIREDNYITRRKTTKGYGWTTINTIGSDGGHYNYRDQSMEWTKKCGKNSSDKSVTRKHQQQTCYNCTELRSVGDLDKACLNDTAHGRKAGCGTGQDWGSLDGLGDCGWSGGKGHYGCFSYNNDHTHTHTCFQDGNSVKSTSDSRPSSGKGSNVSLAYHPSGAINHNIQSKDYTPTYGDRYKIGNTRYYGSAVENTEKCRGTAYGEDKRCSDLG